VFGASRTGMEYPERVGQPCMSGTRSGSAYICSGRTLYMIAFDIVIHIGHTKFDTQQSFYYMRTGSCKFGASCKYHHPRQGGGVALDEKECSYYVKTGQCKFGATCKFHHPQPAGVQVPAPLSVPQVSSLPVRVPSIVLSNCAALHLVLHHKQYGVMVARPPLLPGLESLSGSYKPCIPSSTPSNVGSTHLYGNTQLPSSAPAYTSPYQPAGSAFGPSTLVRENNIHYQKDQVRSARMSALHEKRESVDLVLPVGVLKIVGDLMIDGFLFPKLSESKLILSQIAQGAPPCTHYVQRGVCKFGPACRFDHSMGTLTYSPSASSLVNMPVVSIPVGSSISTRPPSSSSSELQPERNPGSSREPGSFRISSSMSTATGSVGLALSTSGNVSESSAQTSAQSSVPVATTTITTTSTVSHAPS
ncbi:zinc finger CCCH domain-containing protein 34-like, partial [Prosopis cineraria]|uniref:zinc finger CCCH domain-containing protein 34-like n=1 Tax=Prosopis cineraria TaxID=364024 RepID=UPI00240F1A40